MQFDYSKLRGLIREKMKTEGAFALAIGRTQNFVSNVFNGKTYFEYVDIVKTCDLLGIAPEDIGTYFFTREVHEKELE